MHNSLAILCSGDGNGNTTFKGRVSAAKALCLIVGLTSWMEIAEHEQEGSARPRQEYERAIWAMANFISDSVYDRDVDDQTITTLVAFLEDHYPQGRAYIRSNKVSEVAFRTKDQNVRLSFGWGHVFVCPVNESDKFRIRTETDLSFINWMKQQASHRNLSTSFDPKANELISAYEEEKRRQKIDAAARQAAEVAIQARLRG